MQIHARDPHMGYALSSSNPEHYYTVNKAIRTCCPEIIINNTTGGGINVTREERLSSITAKARWSP